jgi:hypothetical protein
MNCQAFTLINVQLKTERQNSLFREGRKLFKAKETIEQCCPTFLYIGAHLTDGCAGAGACGDCNNNNNNKVILIEILIKMTTNFIFYDSIS